VTARPYKQEFGLVPVPKAETNFIFHPNELLLIGEAPSLHNRECIFQAWNGSPKEQHTIISRDVRDGQRRNPFNSACINQSISKFFFCIDGVGRE
jgi:hypothetical protein